MQQKQTKHTITVDTRYCKGCKLCLHVCKRNVYTIGHERSALGYEMPAVTDLERCVGCGLCEKYCPDMAIHVA